MVDESNIHVSCDCPAIAHPLNCSTTTKPLWPWLTNWKVGIGQPARFAFKPSKTPEVHKLPANNSRGFHRKMKSCIITKCASLTKPKLTPFKHVKRTNCIKREISNHLKQSTIHKPEDKVPFTISNLQNAIRKMQLNKAAGPDGIHPEVIFSAYLIIAGQMVRSFKAKYQRQSFQFS